MEEQGRYKACIKYYAQSPVLILFTILHVASAIMIFVSLALPVENPVLFCFSFLLSSLASAGCMMAYPNCKKRYKQNSDPQNNINIIRKPSQKAPINISVEDPLCVSIAPEVIPEVVLKTQKGFWMKVTLP